MSDDAPRQSILDRLDTEVSEPAENFASARKLLPRKRRMVMAYVKHGTYAAAAAASGFTAATVKRLLDNDEQVREAVAEMVDQAAINSMVSMERVLAEIARIAFFDVGEFTGLLELGTIDHAAALQALNEMPADARAVIASLKFKTGQHGQTVEFTTYSKQTALQDLARILSMYDDRLTISDRSGFGELLHAAITKLDKIGAPSE